MERDVSAETVGEEEAGDYAFVDDVESSSIVKAMEVRVSLTYAREKYEFTWQSRHCILLCVICFKALSRTFKGTKESKSE